MEYPNNDLTQMVEDEYFALDFENEELPSWEKMKKFEPSKNFVRYVHKMACECGYKDEKEDANGLVKFVLDRCKEEEIGISRATLSNWLNVKETPNTDQNGEGMPSANQNGRRNVYGLCFALKMNEKQTEEFFLKAYLERPFYYKDMNEAIYFFCLKNGLTYNQAKKIKEAVENAPYEALDNLDADELTAQIHDRLDKIKDKDDLIAYLCDNRAGFVDTKKAPSSQTALKEFRKLLARCIETAQQELKRVRKNEPERYDFKEVKSVANLLQVIYGYYVRTEAEDAENKSGFPKYVRKNWPKEKQFENIEKENASFDVVRRALIVLQFYDYAATVKLNSKETLENGVFDELTGEINEMLARCGYGRLYWLNPFDWLFGYCAMSYDPLDTLRGMIAKYYLRDLDESETDEPEE